MKKNNILIIYVFIFLGVFISPPLFYTSPSKDFIVYRSEISIGESHKRYIKRNLGIKEKFKDKKVHDEDYTNVLALNNEKVLGLIAINCNIPEELKPYNRKVTIRRQKSFGYFYVVFEQGLELHSDCIKNEFNSFLAENLIKKYEHIISNLQEDSLESKQRNLSLFMIANLEYYKILSYMVRSNKEIYIFNELSEVHKPDNLDELKNKLYLAVNLSLALLFFRLFFVRDKKNG
jgi:YesN/AraC family two-component response regulator